MGGASVAGAPVHVPTPVGVEAPMWQWVAASVVVLTLAVRVVVALHDRPSRPKAPATQQD
nr:hypothetical protein GCM10020241_52470 [Streptoalloteichus tenebrarius]